MSGVIYIISDKIGDLAIFKWVLNIILGSPILLSLFMIRDFYYSMYEITIKNKISKEHLFTSFLLITNFCGSIIFLIVTSAFVAYQSFSILKNIQPALSSATKSLLE